MGRIIKYIITAVGFIGMLVGMSARAVADQKQSGRDARKSRYYYYEGLRQSLSGDVDAAYECYRRSVMLDSTNKEAQYQLAVTRMDIMDMDLRAPAEINDNLRRMRLFVDEYPDDGNENLLYGYMAALNDTTGEGIRVLERLAERQPDNTPTFIYLSQAYAQEGETEKAVEAMNRYERAEGVNPTLTMHKMSLYMEAGDTLGAIREADRLILHDPRNYKSLILKGNLHEVINQRDSAEYYYIKAERLSPESSEPKIALMDIYRLKGDSVAYDAKVYEVLLTEDMEVAAKTQLLADYLQKLFDNNNDTSRGDYLFSVLESQYPHDADVLDLAARYSYAKGDKEDAIEKVSYALDLNSRNRDLWLKLLYYQGGAEKYKDAIATYRRADKEGMADRNMRLYAASLYQTDKQYREARDVYKQLISEIDPGLNPDTLISLQDVRRDISVEDLDFLSYIFTSMGDSSYSAADTTATFRDYENALTLNSDNALAANNYAYFSIEMGGDPEHAEQLSRRSLAGENANNPTHLDTYAWILFLKGNLDEAIEIQMKAVKEMEEAGRTDAVIYDHYADMLDKKGFSAEALKYRRLAAQAEPDNKEFEEKLENAEKREKQRKK